jgi:hypothetical protein
MSRRQNDLIGEFMMALGDVISIWGVGGIDYEVHFNRN